MRSVADIPFREAGRRSHGIPSVRLSPLRLGVRRDSRKNTVEA
jgi:hypothetical protein